MINGICFKNALISGCNNLLKYKSFVDKLNIFPVPDGDTGTNMYMTISEAVKELKKYDNQQNLSISEVATITASSMLRGARGNSGVILSLLFRGISKGLENIEEANGSDLVRALGIGVELAYKAVMKPTEGTILTVARVAYERGKSTTHFNNDAVKVWNEICNGAQEALLTTPDLLPVLKRANVVDSGGKGLCLIFEGMLSVFKDGIIVEKEIKLLDVEPEDEFRNAVAEFDDDIRFTYCTEFIIGRDRYSKAKPINLRKKLEKIGDCVVVVNDDEIIKVHVHTEYPNKALSEGLKFGQLLTVKIENMKEQHRKAVEKAKEKSLKNSDKFIFAEPVNDVGFLSIATGTGIINLFKDLGCEHVVSGGQTMNPSTNQIVDAILATPAKVVYVFPNNKNIIMAAEQAISLVTDRKVVVVPTKTIPQGISSIIAFNPNSSIEENVENMKNEFSKISTGQITFASRNSEFGGFKIKEKDILALDNGKLVFTDSDPVNATIKLALEMSNKDTEFITLIYGDAISKEQAEQVVEKIKLKIKSDVEITLIEGNQPIYHFIISVE